LFCDHVFSAMSGNLNFALPAPYTLLDLQAATAALSSAYDEALGGGTLLTATMHGKEVVFDTVMTAMGKYVDGIAQGSETIILSAGMETKKQREPQPLPARVTGLEALVGSHSGEIDLNWDVVLYNRASEIFMRADTDPVNAYVSIKVCFPTHFTVTGLTSGLRYWFKVVAHGTAGAAEPSDPATSLAY
jgi:hypothetical protein